MKDIEEMSEETWIKVQQKIKEEREQEAQWCRQAGHDHSQGV